MMKKLLKHTAEKMAENFGSFIYSLTEKEISGCDSKFRFHYFEYYKKSKKIQKKCVDNTWKEWYSIQAVA